MDICSKHDGEVCYEVRNCPACELQEEIDSLTTRIKELESKERHNG